MTKCHLTLHQLEKILIHTVEKNASFANLYSLISSESTINTILDVCKANVVRDMQYAALQNPIHKLIDVNTMEKLKKELDTDDRLEAFVKTVTNTSKPYALFDPQEAAKVTPGNMGGWMSMVH